MDETQVNPTTTDETTEEVVSTPEEIVVAPEATEGEVVAEAPAQADEEVTA